MTGHLTQLLCQLCAAAGDAGVWCERMDGDGAYRCEKGHRFQRLEDGEQREILATPERIVRNNGSLY